MAVPLLIPLVLGGTAIVSGITGAVEIFKSTQDKNAESKAREDILNDSSLTPEQKALILASMENEDVSPIIQFGDDDKQVEYIYVPGDNNNIVPNQEKTTDKEDIASTLVQVLVPGALLLGGFYLITKGGK